MFQRVSLNMDDQAILGTRRQKDDVNGIELIRIVEETNVPVFDEVAAKRWRTGVSCLLC